MAITPQPFESRKDYLERLTGKVEDPKPEVKEKPKKSPVKSSKK